MTPAQARTELVEAGKRLLAEGLVARSWGNLSVRLDGKTMAITPSGIPWTDLTEAMISTVDLETGEWAGDWKPSGERKVHTAIYLRRPEVGAIAHTHQNAASVFAAARKPVVLTGRGIPCAPYALPGTKTITRVTVEALGSGPAVLLANHGVFAVGDSLDQVFRQVRALEVACGDLVAHQSGSSLPGRIDSPWDSAWMEPAQSGSDGSARWLSRAPFTEAWSKTGRPLGPVLDDLAQLAGVKVGTVAGAPRSLPGSGVVLVANRGALVSGADAEALAMVVEKACRAVLGGQLLGGAHPLPGWEAALMRVVYRQSYAKLARKTVTKA